MPFDSTARSESGAFHAEPFRRSSRTYPYDLQVPSAQSLNTSPSSLALSVSPLDSWNTSGSSSSTPFIPMFGPPDPYSPYSAQASSPNNSWQMGSAAPPGPQSLYAGLGILPLPAATIDGHFVILPSQRPESGARSRPTSCYRSRTSPISPYSRASTILTDPCHSIEDRQELWRHQGNVSHNNSSSSLDTRCARSDEPCELAIAPAESPAHEENWYVTSRFQSIMSSYSPDMHESGRSSSEYGMSAPPGRGSGLAGGHICPLSSERTSPSRRRRRSRVAPSDAKYTCPECGRKFIQNSGYINHVKTHDPDRPKEAQCNYGSCTRAFVRQTDLHRHIQSVGL